MKKKHANLLQFLIFEGNKSKFCIKLLLEQKNPLFLVLLRPIQNMIIVVSEQETRDWKCYEDFCLLSICYFPIYFAIVARHFSLLTGFGRKSLHPALKANWRSLSNALAVRAMMGRSG